MSDHNNIYNIMGKLSALTPKDEPVAQLEQTVYENVESRGSVLEGVAKVEAALAEKYMGFKKLEKSIAAKGDVEDPGAVAASIGRKKYGKKKFQKAAAAGKAMGEGVAEESVEEDREDKPVIPGTQNRAKSRYEPTNKPAPVKKLDKPTDKFDKIKNEETSPAYQDATEKQRAASTDVRIDNARARMQQRADEPKTLGQKIKKDIGEPLAKLAKGDVKGALSEKAKNKYAIGMAAAKKQAGYGTKPAHNLPKSVITKGHEIAKSINESFNFSEMMKETGTTVKEMLAELQDEIRTFEQTGHCGDKLEAFLKVHNHGKKLMGEEGNPRGYPPGPRGYDAMELNPDFAPQKPQPGVASRAVSAAAAIAKKGIDALTGPDDAGHLQNLRDKMYKESAELNELARLAGLNVDETEEVCNECGMYESQCECNEGNLFTNHLKDTPQGDEFEIDGKKYKDTSTLEEGVDDSNINISTNINTNGHKDVTINATGDQAAELLQMLKIAGLGGSDKAQELQLFDLDDEGTELSGSGIEVDVIEPEIAVDEEDESPEIANNPVEDYFSMKASTMNPGEGDFGEKNMYGGQGDNRMTQRPNRPAQPVVDLAEELAAEYESIKKQL